MPHSVAANLEVLWESDFESDTDWTINSYEFDGSEFSQIDTMPITPGYLDINDASRSPDIRRFHEAWHESDVSEGEWSFKWVGDDNSLDFFAFMASDPSGEYNWDGKQFGEMTISAYMLVMASTQVPNFFVGGTMEPQLAIAQYDQGEYSILDSYAHNDLDKPNRLRILHDDYGVMKVLMEDKVILSAQGELDLVSEKVWFGSWLGNAQLDDVKVFQTNGVFTKTETLTKTETKIEPGPNPPLASAIILAAVILAVPLTYFLRMRNLGIQGKAPLAT
jgi:hypothetical protein